MFYKSNKAVLSKEGAWDEKSCVRRIGGFDIDKSVLPDGMKYLPKGAVMTFDSVTGKVKLIKTAKVYAKAESGATTIKVYKEHALKVGDIVAGVAISAIDSSNANYDELTVASTKAVINKDAVIDDGNAEKVIGLNYVTVSLDDNPTCTVTLQAYEIQEETLPYYVNDAIKEALTCRHAWKL